MNEYEIFTKRIKKVFCEGITWNNQYDKIKSILETFERENGIINWMEID